MGVLEMREESFLDVKKIKEGQCLICGGDCLEGYFMHYECALSYIDYKKRLKEEKNANN